MVALTYLLRTGDTQNLKLKLVQLAKEIWYHLLQCGITVTAEYRLGVKKQFGLLGMETSSLVISENLSTEENHRDRSIFFQTISSDEDLLFLEAGSIEPSSRCLPTKLFPQ